jgi:hypothetical protein
MILIVREMDDKFTVNSTNSFEIKVSKGMSDNAVLLMLLIPMHLVIHPIM